MSDQGPDQSSKLPEFPTSTPAWSMARRGEPAGRVPAVGGPQHTLNNLLAALLVVVLALSTVPLGSNRPAFWTIWGTVVGATGFIYAGSLAVIGAELRIRFQHVWPESLLLAALVAFLILQVLPIGQWLPQSLSSLDGTQILANSVSFDPGSTWLVLMEFGTFAVFFFLTTQVAANRQRASGLLAGVFGIVAVGAIYGLVSLTQLGDTILGFEKESYRGFATGTFVNRNSFATFLAVGLAMGFPLLTETLFGAGTPRSLAARTVQSALVTLAIAFIIAALFATGSRMGTVAGGVAVVLAVGLAGSTLRLSARASIALLVTGGTLAVLLFAVFGTELVERLVFVPGIDPSRSELHSQVWAAIWKRPWLGYGGGSFASVFPVFQAASPNGNLIWDHTHSTYLALWFEMGLFAGTLPLAIVALLAARSIRALRDPSSRTISIAAIAATGVFAVHSLLDFSAEIEANALLFTFLLALGSAGSVFRKRAVRAPDRSGV